jgi:hypothetical protein
MPEFNHGSVRCGTDLRRKLLESVCPGCSWFAAGRRHAIEIAERAHLCPLTNKRFSPQSSTADPLLRKCRPGGRDGQ